MHVTKILAPRSSEFRTAPLCRGFECTNRPWLPPWASPGHPHPLPLGWELHLSLGLCAQTFPELCCWCSCLLGGLWIHVTALSPVLSPAPPSFAPGWTLDMFCSLPCLGLLMDPLTSCGQALCGCAWVGEGLPALGCPWPLHPALREQLALASTDKVLSVYG